MPGGKDLEQLRLHKQALLVESTLNRHALVAEINELRSGVSSLSNAVLAPKRLVPLLLALAPVAGFLAFRSARRPVSLISRLAKLAKWIGPAYSIWRSFSVARKQAPEGP